MGGIATSQSAKRATSGVLDVSMGTSLRVGRGMCLGTDVPSLNPTNTGAPLTSMRHSRAGTAAVRHWSALGKTGCVTFAEKPRAVSARGQLGLAWSTAFMKVASRSTCTCAASAEHRTPRATLSNGFASRCTSPAFVRPSEPPARRSRWLVSPKPVPRPSAECAWTWESVRMACGYGGS